jgi:hypothetical protein
VKKHTNHTLLLAAIGCLLIAIGFSLLPANPARADEAGAALVPFDKPIDQAIDKALAFLAKRQKPDGSFESPVAGDVAVTSLSVMAFLAKGHTPGRGPYGEVVNKGVDFVLDSQATNAMIVGKGSPGPMYCHCMASLMLSEASGMVDRQRQVKIDAVLPKAMSLILAAQQVAKPPEMQGGWRYGPTAGDSDISCSGWALMALRSARNNGSPVPKQAIENAVKFLMSCHMPDGGFAYQPHGGSGPARTGVGLLGLELCGHHRDIAAVGAGDWVLKNLPKNYGEGYFYYALYYTSQGMFQLGGNYWDTYALNLYNMMIKFQQPDGSWPQGSGQEGAEGLCYSTAMGVLSMSVSYRQLPIYQR